MIRIGVIGAGPNGTGHVEYFSKSPRSRVVAIADPDRNRADILARQCNAKAVADYHQLLELVDAVVISSPNHLHKEHAIAAAAAGKHVYCEKPMGLSLSDAREIAAAITAAKVASAIGFTVRFEPIFHTMAQTSKQGGLGRIVSICSRRLFYLDSGKTPEWRRDHRTSGGLLLEINIHEIDWMMAVGGEVESVYARTWASQPNSPRANDQLFVTLEFAGGAIGMHEGSWLSPIPNFYRSVQGTEAAFNTDEWGAKLYHAVIGKDRVEMPAGEKFDLRGNFLDSIRNGEPTVADVNCGRKVMAVVEAIFESAATGKVVKLSDLQPPALQLDLRTAKLHAVSRKIVSRL